MIFFSYISIPTFAGCSLFLFGLLLLLYTDNKLPLYIARSAPPSDDYVKCRQGFRVCLAHLRDRASQAGPTWLFFSLFRMPRFGLPGRDKRLCRREAECYIKAPKGLHQSDKVLVYQNITDTKTFSPGASCFFTHAEKLIKKGSEVAASSGKITLSSSSYKYIYIPQRRLLALCWHTHQSAALSRNRRLAYIPYREKEDREGEKL